MSGSTFALLNFLFDSAPEPDGSAKFLLSREWVPIGVGDDVWGKNVDGCLLIMDKAEALDKECWTQ